MNELSSKIIELIENARFSIAKNTNSTIVVTYFTIGKMIVEGLQAGEKRAEYGKGLLTKVSIDLMNKFKRGYSVQNLERMRNFYSIYSNSSKHLRNSEIIKNSSNILRIFDINEELIHLLPISWSHYLFLMKIENEYERQFYEIESYLNQWKLDDLIRQFNAGLFERLALSKNKDAIINLAKQGQKIENAQDIYKEPLILEFLGLEENSSYSESDLETAIINQIEKFMLELGKGFFFGGRQVRFTFDEEHFWVDLVFYNRILKCFVLIDLKIGKLTHQDLGQMQMYVNYYDRFVKDETENLSIGIVMCKHKNQSLVEITLPKDNTQLFAAKYQTILPSKDDLIKLIKRNY